MRNCNKKPKVLVKHGGLSRSFIKAGLLFTFTLIIDAAMGLLEWDFVFTEVCGLIMAAGLMFLLDNLLIENVE